MKRVLSAVQTVRRGLALELSEALGRAIHASPFSREVIAIQLTTLVGREISSAQIDAWTADSKRQWYLPADVVPALCEILQDDAIQRQLLSPDLRRYLELGESATKCCDLSKDILAVARARQSIQRRAGK